MRRSTAIHIRYGSRNKRNVFPARLIQQLILLLLLLCGYWNEEHWFHAVPNPKTDGVYGGAGYDDYYCSNTVTAFSPPLTTTTTTTGYRVRFPSLLQQSSYHQQDDDDDDDDDYLDMDDPSTTNHHQHEQQKKSLERLLNKPTLSTFGPKHGRSAPSQRKAMGTSGSGTTTVHVCTNCGAEFVKWIGRCPTCKEWNTVQEVRVDRGGGGNGGSSGGSTVSKIRNKFGTGGVAPEGREKRPTPWLSQLNDYDSTVSSSSSSSLFQPVRMTDVYPTLKRGTTNAEVRRICVPGDDEWNTVLGGGIMPGSLILLGGDPGVGKSTLLLQVAGSIASLATPPRRIGMGRDDPSAPPPTGPVLYVSGEENPEQIASRALRLGIDESELLLLCETDADFIVESVANFAPDPYDDGDISDEETQDDGIGEDAFRSIPRSVLHRHTTTATARRYRRKPSLLIIDSIQTMLCEAAGSSATGGVTQVRECVGLFLRLAKSTGIPIVLIGHVTKTGDVAGPRTVEHMVDAVLYLEGNRYGGGRGGIRMLRAAKNRFGSSEEVGVYEMDGAVDRGGRLVPVSDPSSVFLAERIDTRDTEGCAISLVVEGLRPMAVEVQALVSRSMGGGAGYGGRRTVQGVSNARLLLILAVLQKRYGISFHRQDVFVNVVGGVSLNGGGWGGGGDSQKGSGSDLAVAIALVSSLTDVPVRADTAFVGEIGLLGELRSVSSLEKRIGEAKRMGFSRVVIPKWRGKGKKGYGNGGRYDGRTLSASSIEIVECENVLEAINRGLTSKLTPRTKRRGRKVATEQVEREYYDDSDKIDERWGETESPGSVDDLHLDDIIDDDEDFAYE